jgi:GNAT superfamily N-acetyltransferase
LRFYLNIAVNRQVGVLPNLYHVRFGDEGSLKEMEIRDGDVRDLEKILSLRRLVFGAFEEDKLRPDFWKWEFMEGPDGKGFIYVAEDEGRLAGHFADIPRRFSVNGEVSLGTLSLDLMVHPDYRRRGLFHEMGRYAAQRVKKEKGLFMTAFPIRKETIAGFLKYGWEVVGELPVLVYPIHFGGMINRYLHFSPLSFVIGGIFRGGYVLLRGRRRTEVSEGITLEEVTQLDEKFDRFWKKASTSFPILGVRDRTFLSWRYLKNPARTYTLYRALDHGEMVGYLILRKVDLLRFNSAVIVDLLALNDQTLRALVRRGIEHSQGQGADLLGCMIPKKHPYHRTLRDSGFLPTQKSFLFMVYRHERERVSLDPEAWYVNWGDTDVI